MSQFKGFEYLRGFPKTTSFKSLHALHFRDSRQTESPLVEIENFGPNPGDLKMFSFIPLGLSANAPLVVVLHGCTQTAASYDVGAGWSALADRYGFCLLMPEQKQTNNANRCFSWFNPKDCERDEGEAYSIRQMIAYLEKSGSVDPNRIFVTGLSAGGAMASVMLATYPDVFAGGAIIAGLPYGIATNVEEAFRGMHQPAAHSAEMLGDMVRTASKHQGPWPKISVWHGGLDVTVNPSNASAIVQQWLDVHGLRSAPMAQTAKEGHEHAIWWNEDGDSVVELHNITRMPHGTPIGVGESEEFFGVVGPFLIDAGISSSFHIANFFDLTNKVFHARSETESMAIEERFPTRAHLTAQASDRDRRAPNQLSQYDVGTIINKALTAAGLIK